MTGLSPRNCLPSQLPGVVTARHGTLRELSLARRGPRKSNERFVVVSNSKSCRNPDICICINGFESQGFVHKSLVSRDCKEHSEFHIENKKLKYFALLKEYINSVTSIRNLICELETFSEEQCNDEGNDNNYACDLSKVLNILERFRSDMKHMKGLEVRFKSFLKSEMLYLSHTIGLTLKGFTKFISSAEHQVIQNVYMILKKELKNLVGYSVDELCRKNSSWNENCIHVCQLAGKFEKLAYETTNEVGKWSKTWRDRIFVSISKRGGVRTQCPLLYLKKLSQPYLLGYIRTWMLSMSLYDNLTNFINVRAFRVSNYCIELLYLLVFKEERFWQQGQNEPDETKDSELLPSHGQRNENKSKHTKKSLAISIRSFRSKFFQGLWENVQKEEPLISSFVMTLLNSNFSPSKGKAAHLAVDLGKRKIEVDHEKTIDLGSQNGLSVAVDVTKSPGASKKVQWDDMVNPNFSKETIDSHMDSLWKSLSRRFVSQLCYQYSFADQENHNWDFSIATIDPGRASIAMSCLSAKKLRSDSGSIHPSFSQCARNISAQMALVIYMQRWDNAVRQVQVSALKDKCRVAPNAAKKCSETMSMVVDALQPVHSSLALLASSRGSEMQTVVNEFEYEHILAMPLFCFITVLRTAIDWLQTKSQQFVSSASWEQYLVVTIEDTSALQEKLRQIAPHVLALSKKVHLLEKPNLMLEHTLECIQKMFSEVKMIRTTKNDVLVASVKTRAKRAIKQHLPDAKQWRKKGATRLPFEANSYIKVVPNQVLAPVIESVRVLEKEEIEDILCTCFSAFITSLMDYILEESIKFSYYGANQLLLDFGCFKEWITRLDPQYLDSDTVSIILANNSFEEFSSAIKLLCCQPESRRRSNTGSVSDTDGTSSVGSTTSHGSYNGSFFEPTISQIELKNKERWLSLRVKGGQSKNRLLCINPS